MTKRLTLLTLLIAASATVAAQTDKPVHLFILSGQSNMQGMNPETGFMPEAKQLFKDEEVVYIKVAKGGQPICRWLEEWLDIAKENGLDENHRRRIHRDGKVEFYQPILDQYQEMLKKHPKLTSVTFCWMQGERDANGGAHAPYKDALKLLISNLRRDLKRPDMNIVIGRIGDYAMDRPSIVAVRKAQREIANEDPRGAWVDVDDLNDREKDGKIINAVHYKRPEGYIILGQRFARQGYALIKGKKPAENGRPGDQGPQEIEKKQNKEAKEKRKKRAEATEDKPNVLFIAIDDLRPELGCYGVDYIQSPRIDAFAKTARLFTHHYVTAPTCGASRYALLTGRSPRNNYEAGNLAFKMNLEFTAKRRIESFPHLFKEAGYETLSIGKICHGKQDTLPRSWSRILDRNAKHPDFQNNAGKKQRHAARGLDLPDAAYFDGAMTDTVIKTLGTLKGKPFFFAVGFVKPHLPFWAPKKYFDLYDPEKIPQAEWRTVPDSPSYHPSFELMQQYGHHPEAGLEDPTYRRHLKHGYAACVSFVDAQIGRILDEVEALGLDDNTIIVLWGDHGWHLGEHRIFGKHTSFERALKSVLILRTPGMKNPGRPTDALVQSIDIYPTLAELCGLTPPADIVGKPFLDLLDDPNLPGPEYALSYNLSYGAPFRKLPRLHAVTLRTRDYRYIQWQRDLGRGDILFQELYDHRSDPKEADNLATKKPEVVKRLEELLAEHRDDNASSKEAAESTAGGIETDAAGPRWQVSTTEDWQAFIADTNGIKIADGHAIAEKPQVSFTSQLKQFPEPIKLKDIELRQSVEWLNWQPCSLYQPNMKNAPVMISHGPNDHWIIAQYRSAEQLVEAYQAKVADAKKRNRKPPPPLTFSIEGFEPEEVTLEGYDEKLVTTPFPNQYQPSEWKGDYSKPPLKRAWKSGFHAWHSRDMIHWVHYGPTAAAPTVTTAEYADGKTFFYYDRPNDRDPHLIIDHDLRDGLPGKDKGLAFDAPWGGSDVGVIRDLEGKFHMISENWQPIDASKRSWDSPLASHIVSETGITDFQILEPAVDYRTKPTGKTATFEHPHWKGEEKVVTYEIHEPRQDAFGDWAAIAIGGQYYLVGDYDPANAEHGRNSMSVALFTSEDINTPFRFYGHIGSGHPDPDIMFADGKFYLITQTATDFVSDGPWVGTAKVRAGVDENGDGKIDQWSKWQDAWETYSAIPGFAKQVDRTPAKVSFPDLPAGKGFQIEVKLSSSEDHKSLPKIDQLIATFESSQK